jgi:HipA-like protein
VTTESRITLLHLSDVQFGPHHRFEPASSPGSLLHRLRDDLAKMKEDEGLKPDLVLLTGDLTEYGQKPQFDEVLSFAQGLAEVTELSPHRIILVPGNHDINRDLSESYFANRKAHQAKALQPYWPKLEFFAELFARFYEGQPGISFSEAEPYTLFDYPELGVVVAGMNSAIAESHQKEHHYGFLGEKQLRFFAEKLRPYKERGILSIAAVHHDPLLLGDNDEARQDQKDFKGMLAPYLNFVTHGHIHEEKIGWADNNIPVLAIGSAGVKADERPPEIPNQYQLIQLFADRLAYGTRAYLADKKRWIGCLRSDPNGEDWRVEKKVAFSRVEGTFSASTKEQAAPAADLALMVDAYRRHWASAYRHEALFELATRGEDSDIPAGLDLIHVFLAQTARRESRSVDLPRDLGADADAEEELRQRRHLRRDEEKRREAATFGPPQPIDRVVASASEPWLLVLGAPGAGKSALTRWLVLKLCAPGESLDGLSADLVPVRIELRRFDLQYSQAHKSGRAYDFFDYLDESHREDHLSLRGAPLRRLAESGRLLWIIDGLDEVADPRARGDYARMIAGLRERHGGRGVVTSRIVGARPVQPLLESAGLATYTLQDFDGKQIDAFIERWHRLAFPGALEAGARRLERLRSTLRENRAVRDLCGNPLLLTLIALLNRGGELPKQRHRLYERTIELMADNWEANKQLNGNGAIGFDLADKKRFLRRLAYRMMTDLPGGAGNAIRERDLIAFASEFCAREYNLDPEKARTRAEQLIAHLRERNYVLTLLGGQTFGFVHKTFLEYLTAAEIHARFQRQEWTLEEIKTVFKKHWRDQAWEETLTLICGMLEEERPEQVVDLLQAVIERIDPLDSDDRAVGTFVAFATRCLVEVRQLEQEPIHSFAVRLTDWAVENPISDSRDRLLSALRLCGPAWPGRERFASACQADIRGAAPHTHHLAASCWLALSEQRERLTLLKQFLPNERASRFAGTWIREAGLLGEWSHDDLCALESLIATSPHAIQLTCWIALLDTGATTAALQIGKILRRSQDVQERYVAATALLQAPAWRTEAANAFISLLQSPREDWRFDRELRTVVEIAEPDPAFRARARALLSSTSSRVRYIAARDMSFIWQDDDAVQAWIGSFRNEPRVDVADLSALEALAQANPDARACLDSLLSNSSATATESDRLQIAQWLMDRDGSRAAAILKELALSATTSSMNRVVAAVLLTSVPQQHVQGLEVLSQLADDPVAANAIESSFWILGMIINEPGIGAFVLNVAKTGRTEALRATASVTLAGSASSLLSEALLILCQIVASAAGDMPRISAAIALRDAGHSERDWRPVLEHLSRSAKHGSARLAAAKALRDEHRISRLSERAKSPKVRREAAEALQRLRLYNALLAVGRHRRGIVSLDGIRAGVIEETPQGSRFTYDKSYLTRPGALPISPTLPLQPEPHTSSGLHPFFENLLPEGWLLDHTCRKLGLDPADAFGVMLATCADCAGAVEIVPEAS